MTDHPTEARPYTTRDDCRSCGSEALTAVLSMGEQALSMFLAPDALPVPQAPLDLVLCDACGLLQLRHTASPELLYREYWYRSGVNQTMRDHLAEITRAAEARVELNADDVVLDIGCNDGTLLRTYRTPGVTLAGFEPARNLVSEAEQGTTQIINELFAREPYLAALGDRPARVITSIAMFYDLDDPNQFVADAQRILSPDGVWVIEMNYLRSMLEQNAFDNICHEHVAYYSLRSLEQLLQRHGLEVFDVELNELNGGSFRAYVQHPAVRPVTDRVSAMRATEGHLTEWSTYERFAERVNAIRTRLHDFVRRETAQGKSVYVYGASTRGNTLLQYFGLDHTLITAAAERNPAKYGLRTPGTQIPIVAEQQARDAQPDYFLVLPWAFLPEFQQREREFLAGGGRLIVPLPEPRLIGRDGEARPLPGAVAARRHRKSGLGRDVAEAAGGGA